MFSGMSLCSRGYEGFVSVGVIVYGEWDLLGAGAFNLVVFGRGGSLGGGGSSQKPPILAYLFRGYCVKVRFSSWDWVE